MKKSINSKSNTNQTKNTNDNADFIFKKDNYILLIAGLLFIFIGLLLMIGGGSEDPEVFSNEIFNFRRLTLSPILIATGFIIQFFAIMKKN